MRFDVEVKVNGQSYSTDNREQWRRLNATMESLYDLNDASAYVLGGHSAQRAAENENTLPPSAIAFGSSAHTTKGEYENPAEKAWRSIGKPATAVEIHKMMESMGYQSRANNPLDATKRMIRSNPQFVRLTPANHIGPALWALRGSTATTQQGDSQPTSSIAIVPTESTPSFAIPLIKSLGTYAREVLAEANSPLPVSEIAKRMEAKGWETRSDTPEKKARAVHEMLRRDGGFFFYGKGVWGLKEWRRSETTFESLTGLDAEDHGSDLVAEHNYNQQELITNPE